MTQIILTCGLCFGDEGKGTIVRRWWLATTRTRWFAYSGGPQAAHGS